MHVLVQVWSTTRLHTSSSTVASTSRPYSCHPHPTILTHKVVRYSDVDGETLAVLDVVRQDGESIGEARATDTAGGADGGGTSGGISVAAFEEALRDDEEALAAEFGIPPLAGALPGEIPGETNMEVVEEPEEEELSVEEAVAGVRSDAEPFNWVLIAPKAGATPRTPRANMLG